MHPPGSHPLEPGPSLAQIQGDDPLQQEVNTQVAVDDEVPHGDGTCEGTRTREVQVVGGHEPPIGPARRVRMLLHPRRLQIQVEECSRVGGEEGRARVAAVELQPQQPAGRLHTQDNLMRQLTKIRDVTARKIPGAPHEVLLVLDATSGQNAIAQAEMFKKAIDVTGIFLAKLDGTAKGGIVLAINDALNIPVKLVGVGETPDDVEPFDPDSFIESMFSYASEDQKMRYIEKYPVVNHALLSFSIMNKPDRSMKSGLKGIVQRKNELDSMALEMVLKAKGIVIDAVSAEKEIIHYSEDDKIKKPLRIK